MYDSESSFNVLIFVVFSLIILCFVYIEPHSKLVFDCRPLFSRLACHVKAALELSRECWAKWRVCYCLCCFCISLLLRISLLQVYYFVFFFMHINKVPITKFNLGFRPGHFVVISLFIYIQLVAMQSQLGIR